MSAVAEPTDQKQINPKLVVPFVNAVRNVFSTMVGIETTVQRPHVKGNPAASYDVSAIIGFGGEIIGSVVLSLDGQAAVKLVESFAGVEFELQDPDFADAVGELANMIAGGAKKDLHKQASITTPSVVIGNGHTIARLKDVPCLVIPCTTEVGDFAVEISVKEV